MAFFDVSGIRACCRIVVAVGISLMSASSYGDSKPADNSSIDSRLSANAVSHCDPDDFEYFGDYENCVLTEVMTVAGIGFAIGTIEGLFPPPLGTIGEAVAYGEDLLLKGIRPRLEAPNDISVDPTDTALDQYIDGCGIQFELLSAKGGYSNLFGIINIGSPYTQLFPREIYPFRNYRDPDDPHTRWGFLRAPKVYHVNTDVEVEVRSRLAVQKYNQATGLFEEPKPPINTFSEEPQDVYLPIGQHTIDWHASTIFNSLFHVVIPGGQLLKSVYAEYKAAGGGADAAKEVKKSGIGEEAADEAASPGKIARANRARKEFTDYLKKAFDDRKSRLAETRGGRLAKKVREFMRKKTVKAVKKVLLGLLKKLARQGINSIDGSTRDEILSFLPSTSADLVGATWDVYSNNYRPGVLPGDVISGNVSFDIPFITNSLDLNIQAIVNQFLSDHGPDRLIEALDNTELTSIREQTITVWDYVPPTIDIDPTPLTIEAKDFGGIRLSRVRAQLLEIAKAASSDNCGRTPVVSLSGDDLLPLDLQKVTITARDRGANPTDTDLDFAPTAELNIFVQDTQPPLLLAPPSKVILSTTDVTRDAAEIGDAVAIDLVDVQPKVENDAVDLDFFQVDTRTRVLWTATDTSGNSAESLQLITVKASNTPPTANESTAVAVTAEPIDIKLTANDTDELDNQFDPLTFRIESQPENGEFVAPLYPFFIEDYRTRPNDGLPDFDPDKVLGGMSITDKVRIYVANTYCSGNPDYGDPPRSFVYKPRFVHVTDDGLRFVLDEFFVCGGELGNIDLKTRFSKWGAAGAYLGQLHVDTESNALLSNTFRVDRDGLLYYNQQSGAGSSRKLFLKGCEATNEWTDNVFSDGVCPTNFEFSDSDDVGDSSAFRYARIDSTTNVVYVVSDGIYAAGLGELGPKDADGVVLDDWFGDITTLEIGSDGAIYANDEGRHRIHKIAPATFDENGDLILGQYIGWAGKCTGSGYGDCDESLERSYGYSCTWDDGNPTNPTCETSEISSCRVDPNNPEGPRLENYEPESGCRQGQFDTPKYISIDPNDVLYVADFENSRIQRFSPDGSFAGEAVSTGSGVNKGDRPSFILGNMGKPESVAVNSSQFFVVDWREKFVYVFGTLPFKNVWESTEPGASMEATVTYVSDQRFPNPNVVADDMFSFSVTDGLDRSEPANVTITVSRNYRPPQAASITINTPEDTSVDFKLPAGDPDGVIGEDPDGLDTLTYSLTRWPENGTVSGYADTWTYTPSTGFYGEDELKFKVNDGNVDSNEATLTFNVTAVNDPPVVTAEVPEKVAFGFPTVFEATFTDDGIDGAETDYEAHVDWDDGGSDITGEFTNDGEQVGIAGVVVLPPATSDSEGRTIAEHTYEALGEHVVQVCVTDSDASEGCDEFAFDVESLVVMGGMTSIYELPMAEGDETLEEIADGSDFRFELMVVNAEPSVGTGLPAEDVVLDLLLPDDLDVADIAIEQGSCTRSDREVTCEIGMLEPGVDTKLTMTAIGPGNLIYDEARYFDGVLSTSSDALNQEIGVSTNLILIADTNDSDGDGMSDTFEITYGLNPGVDDSANDGDADGLSNIEEFNEGTSPLVADTDGDGMSDGDEFVAGTDPLSDDIPPELIAPADIEVDSTGTLTQVNIGIATAQDFKDGTVEVFADDPGPFRPGHHVVTWTAFDEAGNRGNAYQFVKVVPLVNFHVAQSVAEGRIARVQVELNGSAVNYPVTVPFEISGTAVNPDDHDGVSGEAVIAEGLSTNIEIAIAKDMNSEPDETIVLTMGVPINAVGGSVTQHAITVTELNRRPKVDINVEQQGRAMTSIASGAGIVGIIAKVRDDPAQDHTFDWSASDPALVDPVTVNDPAYLLEPSGLSAGMYAMRVGVTDDGLPPLNSEASSLLNVTSEQTVLKSDSDSDGDGASDAEEGPGDSDGDRIADYLDNVANTNVLPLAADGRMLETIPGLVLRLGATAFSSGQAYAAVGETDVATDIDFGYGSDVVDFEISILDHGGSAQVVVPLAYAISAGAVYRTHVNGQWQNFVEDPGNFVSSAPGDEGACPPAANDNYVMGLTQSAGCLQLSLTDGGVNDSDGVANGVIRIIGGLAVPISARAENTPQTNTTLVGDGEATMVRLRLRSESGGVELNSVTLQAGGTEDDLLIDDVVLIHDVNYDGEWDDDDNVLASDTYTVDDGTLTLFLGEPIELQVGDTDLLVIYVFGAVE